MESLGVKLIDKLNDTSTVIFACYLPPESSPWGRDSQEYFSHLLSQTYLLDDIDYIFLCGDFNAKIGSSKDYIDSDDIGPRSVIDNAKNMHGDSLIDFLLEAKMWRFFN